jgi:DNA polymerase-3 subunit epsilon
VREIALDTETTGLQAKNGDRVLEIGCVELSRYGLTGETYHQLINPERDVPEEASAVHGLTLEILKDKPTFKQIIDEFIEFVRGARVIIHNAPFDVGFLNEEFKRLKYPPFEEIAGEVVDSLELAKKVHPQMRNTLDALCTRYNIDNSHRTKHGALLDAELLAQVFLVLRQQQNSFDLQSQSSAAVQKGGVDLSRLKVIRATDEEVAAHEAVLAKMEAKNKTPTFYHKTEEEITKLREEEQAYLDGLKKKKTAALESLGA